MLPTRCCVSVPPNVAENLVSLVGMSGGDHVATAGAVLSEIGVTVVGRRGRTDGKVAYARSRHAEAKIAADPDR